MKADYRDVHADIDPASRIIQLRFQLLNQSGGTWSRDGDVVAGWQLFDPVSDRFVAEGEWTPLPEGQESGHSVAMKVPIQLPADPGPYHVYLSLLRPGEGWAYRRGWPLLVVSAEVENGAARLHSVVRTTLPALRRRKWGRTFHKLFTLPFLTIWQNRSLIRSMVRRDILSRYRGSFGDVFWTVLNPLMLMATYYFVFGVVMQSRFAGDTSEAGFLLNFLAGMIPWLAISEALGRAPVVVLENRNLVKKLVFPIETLNVNQVAAALVTQCIAWAIYLTGLALSHGIPASAAWLPALLVPQVLFTLGLSWILAGLGAYFRDLGQLTGFLLTLWFFLTPICYPETQLPAGAMAILSKNPVYLLVHEYRGILLQGRAPDLALLGPLWTLALLTFLAGHAWFYKLKRTFADII